MNIKDLVFWILIIVIISLGIYLVVWINTEPYKCISNPYVYTGQLLEKANDGEVNCLCIASKSGSQAMLNGKGLNRLQDSNPLLDFPKN